MLASIAFLGSLCRSQNALAPQVWKSFRGSTCGLKGEPSITMPVELPSGGGGKRSFSIETAIGVTMLGGGNALLTATA